VAFLGQSKPAPALVQVVCRPGQADGEQPASRVATLRSDFTFELEGIDEPCRIDVETSGWRLRSVAVAGGGSGDGSIEASPGQALQVKLSLTLARSVLEGRLSGAASSDDYEVVAFSEDPRRRQPPSAWIGLGRPDGSGAFRIENLPAGAYFVAVRAVEPTLSPKEMEALQRRATRVVLEDQGVTGVTLSVSAP
jgi:hypothetical protein